MVGVPDVGTKEGGFLLIKNREFLAKLDGIIKTVGLRMRSDRIIKTVGLDRIRSYMRWQAAYNYAPYLSFPFEDELVRYNKRVLSSPFEDELVRYNKDELVRYNKVAPCLITTSPDLLGQS
ncbi:hypothetical protein T484DRAFT_1769077 [Baffinella frigidus]|nr:hypothetical protein T484DRAFT_1769077 [Cryptophyta sp. CCMP2293]